MMLNVIEHDLITAMVYERNFVNVNEKEIKRNNKFVNVGNIKPLKDFPDYYVSDEGKVYSTKYGKTRELKAGKNKGGYLYVCLKKDGKKYYNSIHRLVLSTFSPIPEMNKYQVNHKDEDPTNNKLENLEWCTAKYNCNYGTRIERIAAFHRGNKKIAEAISRANKGRKCPWLSKKVLQYDQNYNLIASFDSSREAGEALGISHTTISYYCNSLKLFRNSFYLQYESK